MIEFYYVCTNFQFTVFLFSDLIFTPDLTHQSSISERTKVTFFAAADVDDLRVCYVLRKGENATSDVFHFSVEDHGKISPYFFRFAFNHLSVPLLCARQ